MKVCLKRRLVLVKATSVYVRAAEEEEIFQNRVLLTKSVNKGDLSRDRKRVFNAISGAITSGKGRSDARYRRGLLLQPAVVLLAPLLFTIPL